MTYLRKAINQQKRVLINHLIKVGVIEEGQNDELYSKPITELMEEYRNYISRQI